MKNVIGCMFACAWMLIVSLATGDYLLKNTELKQAKFARASLGFFAFLSIYQILILPAQIFHFSTVWLCAAFVIESLVILSFERKRLVQLFIECWKEITVVTLMGIAAMVLSFSYTDSLVQNGLADQWFYIKFIRENADLSSYVNLYNPVKGMDTFVQSIYAFSGLHHLYSAVSMLFHVDALFLTLWFGTWLMHATSGAIHLFLINWWPFKNKWMKLIILFSLVEAFTGMNIEYGYLPTYFRNAGGATMLVILLIARYAQTNNHFYLKLVLMMNVALMACQSTHFFISVALTLALCCYEIFCRNHRSVPYFTMIASPCLLYASSLLIYDRQIFVLCIMISVFVLLNLVYYLIKDWNGYPVLVISILIILALGINGAGLILRNPTVSLAESFSHFSSLYFADISSLTWDNLLSLAKILLRWFVLVFLIAGVIQHLRFENEYSWCVVMLAVLFVFFYNPLAVVSVSTFLSGEVYTRFTSLSGSYAVFLLIFGFLITRKYQRIVGIVMMCLMLLVSVGRVTSEIHNISLFDIRQYNKQMLMYRLDDEMMELGMFMKQYSDERLSIIYPKTMNRFMLMSDHLLSSNLMPSFSQMRYDKEINFHNWKDNSLHNQVQAFLMAPHLYFTDYYYQFDAERVPDFAEIFTNSNTDIYVISKWGSDESHKEFDQRLLSFSYLIFETENYEVYRIYR